MAVRPTLLSFVQAPSTSFPSTLPVGYANTCLFLPTPSLSGIQRRRACLLLSSSLASVHAHDLSSTAATSDHLATMSQPVLADCRPRHTKATVDFLKRFTDQETQRRIANQPKPFSAQEHADLRKQLKNVNFIKPRYADETEINIAVVCRKWKRYCQEQNLGEWQAALKNVTRVTMMSFFLRISEWSIGKIKSWGTTQVYIRQFQQLYTTVAGRYMDRNDAKELFYNDANTDWASSTTRS
ncbi:hypothetical protein BDP55DRAFT_687623 [Colletotrichum godetiae]|uniref:FluG domain-containing protein n=1 Tax=Colletotrichum godetiae TaxID=1209918 RepID=A0AAJ0A5I7_9PEZI|nr:uncharacterized protein BDP55DRAFT_687623 [Colletotrichum godetiae]KAK1656904.1 hypothetical protein BDP55DRAFT_687623 [Colletotrichum godetiae]